MKTTVLRAMLLVTLGILTTNATPVNTPPFDYAVSLYRWPTNTTEGNGEWTEKAIGYLGNNGANAGPQFNITFKVTNSAGTEVCNMSRWQEMGIPALKTWGKYEFRLRHPKPRIVRGRPDMDSAVKYTLSILVMPERYASDQNHANDSAKQVFTFTGGGTPSCVENPRPDFH
jgi:hypothetical protein